MRTIEVDTTKEGTTKVETTIMELTKRIEGTRKEDNLAKNLLVIIMEEVKTMDSNVKLFQETDR